MRNPRFNWLLSELKWDEATGLAGVGEPLTIQRLAWAALCSTSHSHLSQVLNNNEHRGEITRRRVAKWFRQHFPRQAPELLKQLGWNEEGEIITTPASPATRQDQHEQAVGLCKCGNIRLASSRRCAECHRAGMKKFRAGNVLFGEARVKANARTILKMAVRRKKLVRGVCEVCGDKKTQAHHDDYSKPLEVRWLCKKHHLEHHGLVPCGT